MVPKTYLARLEEHLQVFRNEGNALSFPVEVVDFEDLDLAYLRIAGEHKVRPLRGIPNAEH